MAEGSREVKEEEIKWKDGWKRKVSMKEEVEVEEEVEKEEVEKM